MNYRKKNSTCTTQTRALNYPISNRILNTMDLIWFRSPFFLFFFFCFFKTQLNCNQNKTFAFENNRIIGNFQYSNKHHSFHLLTILSDDALSVEVFRMKRNKEWLLVDSQRSATKDHSYLLSKCISHLVTFHFLTTTFTALWTAWIENPISKQMNSKTLNCEWRRRLNEKNWKKFHVR